MTRLQNAEMTGSSASWLVVPMIAMNGVINRGKPKGYLFGWKSAFKMV